MWKIEKKIPLNPRKNSDNWAGANSSSFRKSAVTRLMWVCFIDKEDKNIPKYTEKCQDKEYFGEKPPFSPLQLKGYQSSYL